MADENKCIQMAEELRFIIRGWAEREEEPADVVGALLIAVGVAIWMGQGDIRKVLKKGLVNVKGLIQEGYDACERGRIRWTN